MSCIPSMEINDKSVADLPSGLIFFSAAPSSVFSPCYSTQIIKSEMLNCTVRVRGHGAQSKIVCGMRFEKTKRKRKDRLSESVRKLFCRWGWLVTFPFPCLPPAPGLACAILHGRARRAGRIARSAHVDASPPPRAPPRPRHPRPPPVFG